MQLTSVHAERLRDALRKNPLQSGEIRRVEGAGEQYVARRGDEKVDDAGYTKTMTFTVDDISYQIYTKLPPDKEVA